MSHQVCPRCQRANPGEAVYCYFDGIVLRQGVGMGPPPSQLLHEFVFPSGRRCRTFDELVQGCQYEWEDARELLHRGEFAQYLGRAGRLDLARAAQEAQTQADPDIALHNFLSNLPATQTQGPRLDLNPRRLQLKAVRAGEQRQIRLTVLNQGKGLLQGKLAVSEGGQWLKVADGGDGQCALKTARDQEVTLRIDARGLAAPQSYSGRLTVITNGGIAEVPVRLDLTAIPFSRAPYQGATTPRGMAERMRANPKPAVPLLEGGEIARWFAANGWSYPVEGATARGVAAVQQFFEAMGLSKPPTVQLSEDEVRFHCVPPEVPRGKVTLRTSAKKWIYAQVESDVPWLKVSTPSVSGPQQTTIAFEVDSSLMDGGRSHEGTLRILANAGQKLALRVRVDVERPHQPFTRRLLNPLFGGDANTSVSDEPLQIVAEPVKKKLPPPTPVRVPRLREPARHGFLWPLFAGMLLALLFRLLLTIPADLYARLFQASSAARGTLEAWAQSPTLEEGFLRHFVMATWWLGAVLGVLLVWRHGGRWTDLFCGAVAGAGAGLMGSATLGCVLTAVDAAPRALLTRLPNAPASPWVGTPLWVALVCAWWALLGCGIGFLLCGLGRRGARVVGALAFPLAWLFRACGLERAAAFFVPEG
jgi:hypothetical protein